MRLTYNAQMTICVILIILGNILTDTLDHWVYRSVAFIICGLLFIIHPVVPRRIRVNRQSLFWTRAAGVIIILIGVFTRVHFK